MRRSRGASAPPTWGGKASLRRSPLSSLVRFTTAQRKGNSPALESISQSVVDECVVSVPPLSDFDGDLETGAEVPAIQDPIYPSLSRHPPLPEEECVGEARGYLFNSVRHVDHRGTSTFSDPRNRREEL